MSLVWLLLAATVGGLLLDRLGLPGGLIIGAMVGSAAYSVWSDQQVALPGALRAAAYVVLGAAIGAGITRETLGSLRAALVPSVLAAVLIILAGLGIAYLLRLLGLGIEGDVLATSPGALSTVIALAIERDAGPPQVAVFHTVRVILVLASLPLLVLLLPDRGS